MVNSSDLDSDNIGSGPADAATAMSSAVSILIKSFPQRSYARDIRLCEGDIIAAIDGVFCGMDIPEFEGMLIDAFETKSPTFVTIARGLIFFDIFIDGPLGAKLDYTVAQRTSEISDSFANYNVGPKGQYKTYEALRNVHRHVALYDTSYSSIATICPPLWLMQHRAFEPLAAVIAVYAASAAVHWAAFALTLVLISTYFHRIQFRMIRNYNLFTEHYYWVVCAARSTADAQKICREMDPKCTFSFSHVGPPEEMEDDVKKPARRSKR